MNSTMRAIIGGTIGALLILNGIALKTIDRGPKFPKQWDARIAPLAKFVEDNRHLRYEHPVEVRFLTPEQYKKEILGGDDADQELSKEDKAEVERFEAQSRALGLIGDKTSILDDTKQLESEGTDAFYSPETKEIVVYGTDIDIYTQVVLVHELTHVLQDQHFDLSRSFNSDGADSLYKALGEGDATRIEDKYIESLDDDDQEAYYDAIDDSQDSADRSVDDVAPTLLQLFGAPYALGGPMTTIVESEQGVLALDTLFRNPVPSDEGLINVFALLDGERPKDVAAPKVGNGEKLADEGSGFGAITWYLVRASFIDPHVALHAVDGWGGDAYIGYSKNGDECIRADFVGDTPNDTNEMHAALDQWKQAFPPDKVTVTGNDAGVELSACEPDTVPTPRADAGEALSLPVARMQMLQGALDQGMPRDIAECFGARVMDRISLEKLASDKQSDLQDAFNVGMQVGRECAQEAGRA